MRASVYTDELGSVRPGLKMSHADDLLPERHQLALGAHGALTISFSRPELIQLHDAIGAHLRGIGAIPPEHVADESLKRVG